MLDPKAINATCRSKKKGYISTQTFGPWGYAFVDYGDSHWVTDHDGERTRNYIVTQIEKGPKTVVRLHEDHRHIYQVGDYVVFREVEGMTQLNGTKPIKVIDTTVFTITLEIDSSNFGNYTRQGVVENVKVPKAVKFHSWQQSFENPAANSPLGALITPDYAKFGRSELLHAALYGIHGFVQSQKRYPGKDDVDACLKLA